jgi:hypothetical protein
MAVSKNADRGVPDRRRFAQGAVIVPTLGCDEGCVGASLECSRGPVDQGDQDKSEYYYAKDRDEFHNLKSPERLLPIAALSRLAFRQLIHKSKLPRCLSSTGADDGPWAIVG